MFEIANFFFSKVAGDDSRKMGSVLVAIERIAMILARCTIFEKWYLGGNLKLTQGLEKSLPMLYAATLRYLASAIGYFKHNTASAYYLYISLDQIGWLIHCSARIALAMFEVEGFQPMLSKIDDYALQVEKEVVIVDRECKQFRSALITKYILTDV